MRSALEWAEAKTMAADGISQHEIARRLGINRRTVKRLVESDEPPRYRRQPAGSKVDGFEAVIRETLEDWPDIKAPRMTEILRDDYGYQGSIDLVKRKLRELRPAKVRPAQRTGYRPAQVLQLDWAEMPTRPKIGGRERRVYALIGTLPYSGAQSAHFSFDMTAESFLEGHTRIFDWLSGVPTECVYDNLRTVVAKRYRSEIRWNPRFLHLRGNYAFHATACTRRRQGRRARVEGGVRYVKTGFWPARRLVSLQDLDAQYVDWRDRVCNVRLHATGRFPVAERLTEERLALRPLPPERFDYASIALGLRYQQLQRTGHEGWLLPGRHAGSPVSADNLRLRLKRYDICSLPGRHGALLALAARLPAPILADRLGLNRSRAAQWVQAAGATYRPYVELRTQTRHA